MRSTILVLGVTDGTSLANCVQVACDRNKLTPIFVSSWCDWSVSVFPDQCRFIVQSRVSALRVSDRDVTGVLLFGYPDHPPAPPEEQFYQAAEYDALLFGLCILADPLLASRWSYIISGSSDTVHGPDDARAHPLLPRKSIDAIAGSGAVEAVLYGTSIFVRGEDRRIRSEVWHGSPLALECSLACEWATGLCAPYVGVLPTWIAECEGLLDQILRDRISRRFFSPLRRRASVREDERPVLTIVAHRGDSTATHLAYRASGHAIAVLRHDLTHLYSEACGADEAETQIQNIESANCVFARPLLVARNVDEFELAAERHFRVLRALQRRRRTTFNVPSAGHTNVSKVAHLARLSAAGLDVPASLATNDPEVAMNFCEYSERPVYKSGSWIRSIATRLEQSDLPRLSLLPNCPALFQAFIPGSNCRVHCVNTSVFALGIQSAQIDYRFSESSNSYRMLEIGGEIRDKLIAVAAESDLQLSGTDLRWDPATNRWLALEMNRMPAFEFFDHKAGNWVADGILAEGGLRSA